MDKYSIDFETLDKQINAPKRIKLADVKDRIEKVGFGMVRFPTQDKMNLWQIVDGEYIVAMYDDKEDIANGNWSIESDKLNKSATIFYKNTPIKSVAFEEMNIPPEEVKSFKTVMTEKLASNKSLVTKMMNSVDEKYREELYSKYPELKR